MVSHTFEFVCFKTGSHYVALADSKRSIASASLSAKIKGMIHHTWPYLVVIWFWCWRLNLGLYVLNITI